MTYEIVVALSTFAFVSSVTPGPNNMMLLASGANFGIRKTLPHLLGVDIGFTLMVFLVGVGVMSLFDLYPPSYLILKVVSFIYLLYLAWKIANAAELSDTSDQARPITFFQAALFQWVNPKAWTMALTAMSLYAPKHDVWSAFLVTVVFALASLPSSLIWVVAGRRLSEWLTSQKRLRVFNLIMAILLVCSVVPTMLPINFEGVGF